LNTVLCNFVVKTVSLSHWWQNLERGKFHSASGVAFNKTRISTWDHSYP